jgi:hypothetical protein
MPRPYTKVSHDEEKLLQGRESSENGSSVTLNRSWRSPLSNRVSQYSNVLHWLAHGITILLLSVLLVDQRRSQESEPSELYSKAVFKTNLMKLTNSNSTSLWKNPATVALRVRCLQLRFELSLIVSQDLQDRVLGKDTVQRYCPHSWSTFLATVDFMSIIN